MIDFVGCLCLRIAVPIVAVVLVDRAVDEPVNVEASTFYMNPPISTFGWNVERVEPFCFAL